MACPMSMHRLPKLECPPIFDHNSIFALSSVAVLLAIACSCSVFLLHKSFPVKIRVLFIWHVFDALIHFTFGASYLYNVFFSFMSKYDIAYTRGIHSMPMTPANISFLGDSVHLYGSFYRNSMTARLWQEYAKADKRWGGSDLTITGVELVTVCIIAPLALYVCHLIRQKEQSKAYFWMSIIATSELYGGLMAILPEWLSGSLNLDASNFLTLWIYLVLLRGLWVSFPVWILWDAYRVSQGGAESSTPRLSNNNSK